MIKNTLDSIYEQRINELEDELRESKKQLSYAINLLRERKAEWQKYIESEGFNE